jgi:DNA-binding response OmpR family regulator
MKILLVDQDEELRALIAFTLGQSGYESCTATDRANALQLLELESPALALIDQGPLLGGIELCRELRARSRLPIMMLNAHDREEDLLAAFDAGADDYLRKPFSPRVLLARIKALLRRIDEAPVKRLTVGQVSLDVDEHSLQIGSSRALRLTPLEFAAMHLLLSTPGRTVTIARLLAHLWGQGATNKQRMLKQLIYRLRKKIEIDPASPRLIVTTPHAGYRFETESQG